MSAQEKAADGFVRVAAEADVPPNSLLSVELDGLDYKVCLAHADGRIYAFRDNCTHRDFPLSAGEIDDGTIECVWHGARFDMASGRATRLPAIKPVRTYPVRVEDGEIFIGVEE
ncbi:MAG TPA: non-heme iron oxygenase ferredoxin subunit [Longimicrobiales bacterium]|nr:non-heme iron oxygenase ferredoxin subunit [Longimicrobiales bacterium]